MDDGRIRGGDTWPREQERHLAGEVRSEDHGWSVALLGYCECKADKQRGGILTFVPKVVISLRMSGKQTAAHAAEVRHILSDDPEAWRGAAEFLVTWTKANLSAKSAPPIGGDERIVELADRARAMAARAMVSAQASYLIQIIPSFEAAAAWGEEEIRQVLSA